MIICKIRRRYYFYEATTLYILYNILCVTEYSILQGIVYNICHRTYIIYYRVYYILQGIVYNICHRTYMISTLIVIIWKIRRRYYFMRLLLYILQSIVYIIYVIYII